MLITLYGFVVIDTGLHQIVHSPNEVIVDTSTIYIKRDPEESKSWIIYSTSTGCNRYNFKIANSGNDREEDIRQAEEMFHNFAEMLVEYSAGHIVSIYDIAFLAAESMRINYGNIDYKVVKSGYGFRESKKDYDI